MMSIFFELVWSHSHQPIFNFSRCFAFCEIDAIGDTKNVRIDGYRGYAEGGVKYDVGCFSTDARQ